MGIRLHKVLGWGLTDVVYENIAGFADERLNNTSAATDYSGTAYNTEGYKQWLSEQPEHLIELTFLKHDDLADLRLNECFCWGTVDGGLGNVFCVTPLWLQKKWKRYADTIDHTEEYLRHPTNIEDRVEVLDNGPFPHNGFYMDAITHEKTDLDVTIWAKRLVHAGIGAGNPSLEAFAKDMGYEDWAEAEQRIVPEVPDDIVNLCRYGKIFSDEDTIYDLRPMLYTYWG